MKILIIDDEPDVRKLLVRMLGRIGYEVNAVESLELGEAYIQEQKPRVLILDNNLPDGSGVEYIPHLLHMNPDLRIIAMSAMSHLRDRALENGAYEFMEKPVSFPILQATIAKCLQTL